MAAFTTKANTLKVLEGAVKNAIILPNFLLLYLNGSLGKTI